VLHVSQPAVSKALKELEQAFGVSLFERTSKGMIPTVHGESLVRRAKRALAELRIADEEISVLTGSVTGHVAIGTLPYARTLLVPRAVARLLAERPEIEVRIVDGTFRHLHSMLSLGELDFIVGAVRRRDVDSRDGLTTQILFEDRVSVVARRGHPLAAEAEVDLATLAQASWVLPSPAAPIRVNFEKALEKRNLLPPRHFIECESLVTARPILMETDFLGLMSRHRIAFEEEAGFLTTLAVDMEGSERPIGVVHRAPESLSPSARLCLRHLQEVGAEISSASDTSRARHNLLVMS
jgi:LysR family transcriptional regulator of gallate degradation